MTQFIATCKNFNKNAKHYEKHAIMQKIINERLLERLDFLKIQPKFILDLGCGTGISTKFLTDKYPNATIIGIDIAKAMLNEAQQKSATGNYVQANGLALPLADNCIDLIFSNQAIHWLEPLDKLFKELHRVLNIEGCLFFSTLGPDTFKELNQAWAKIDNFKHCHEFADMHNVGDLLLNTGFKEPVLDLEYLSLRYSTLEKLLFGMKLQGIKNQHPNKKTGLTTAKTLINLDAAYQKDPEGKLLLTYEIVYGHAWKAFLADKTKTYIAIDQIKK